jgi:hypothetical protein
LKALYFSLFIFEEIFLYSTFQVTLARLPITKRKNIAPVTKKGIIITAKNSKVEKLFSDVPLVYVKLLLK